MQNDPLQQCDSVVLLELGTRLLGIPLPQVQGVLVLGPITPVPGARWAIAGAVNVRGEVLAVVDLRRLFAEQQAAPVQGEQGVQVRLGEIGAVLLGDRLGGVLQLDAALARQPSPPHPLISAQLSSAQGSVQLLQLEALFAELQRPLPGASAGPEAGATRSPATSGGEP